MNILSDIGVAGNPASLKIVVLQGMFTPADFEANANLAEELEEDIAGTGVFLL